MEITRTYSADLVEAAVDVMLDEIGPRFVPEVWLADDMNIALVNSSGDVALFEAHGSPGVVYGHYFFKSRGKAAVAAAKEFLIEAFTAYQFNIILGYTPTDKLGAMWLTRHLGFTPLQIEYIGNRYHQVWLMHRKDYIKDV